MNYTTHYKLQKDLTVEKYDVNVVNMNSDIIDSALHRLDLKDKSQDELLATKESLNSEVTRAASKENDIIEDLTSEIQRAKSAENSNSNTISNEVTRAMIAEGNISTVLQEHIDNENNPHNVTKEQLGIGNVDNTSDMDKPVSTAQQNVLDSALSTHNISDFSHNDIRLLIQELTTRLNTLADSDDTTLDQLSEIVAYIKNNKNLIDGITTSKVNKNGDTINGALKIGEKVQIWTDNEGGNIDIISKDGATGYQIDGCYNTALRLYAYNISPWNTAGQFIFHKNGVLQAARFRGKADNGIFYSNSEPSDVTNGSTWIGT